MVNAVVATIQPQQVILFGSYSRDEARPDSDLDFLVITQETFGPHHSRRQAAAKVWRTLAQFRVPTDVLLYSAAEVTQWHQSPNHIIARALREGKVLYERSPASPTVTHGRSAGSESPRRHDE